MGASSALCWSLLPVFLSYVLSFVYVGIYWNNHHHMLHVVQAFRWRACCGRTCICCSGLSLFPFVTGWMGEEPFRDGAGRALRRVLLMAAMAFAVDGSEHWSRQRQAIRLLAKAVGSDLKGKISIVGLCARQSHSHSSIRGCRARCMPRLPCSGLCPTTL